MKSRYRVETVYVSGRIECRYVDNKRDADLIKKTTERIPTVQMVTIEEINAHA